MIKLSLLGSALAVCCLTASAVAAQLDDATRQQIYTTAYQNLATEQHNCSTQPCGSAISSEKVESIFNTAYVQVSGKQPSYEDYLQWKYLSNFPTAISSDSHFPQASTEQVKQKSAAVKEMPTTSKSAEKKVVPAKKPCEEKK